MIEASNTYGTTLAEIVAFSQNYPSLLSVIMLYPQIIEGTPVYRNIGAASPKIIDTPFLGELGDSIFADVMLMSGSSSLVVGLLDRMAINIGDSLYTYFNNGEVFSPYTTHLGTYNHRYYFLMKTDGTYKYKDVSANSDITVGTISGITGSPTSLRIRLGGNNTYLYSCGVLASNGITFKKRFFVVPYNNGYALLDVVHFEVLEFDGSTELL